MSNTRTIPQEPRIIAMGSKALMEGFALLGFETHADATLENVDLLLAELLQDGSKALIYLEQELAQGESANLDQVRKEGGRIVITEVPAIHSPEEYHPPVEELVVRVLGPSALEERP